MAEKKTKAAVDIIHKRFYHGKPKRLAELEEARAGAEVARKIYALRTDAA